MCLQSYERATREQSRGNLLHTCIVFGSSALGAMSGTLVQRVLEGSVLIDGRDVAVRGAGVLS